MLLLGIESGRASTGPIQATPITILNELTRACVSPSESSCGTTNTYNYDLNGNENAATLGGTSWTYIWNLSGELTRVSNSQGTQGQYTYDANGRRVISVEGSTTTFYSYAGTSVLYQCAAGGVPTDYVFAGGMEIARVVAGSTAYYHSDALGSTRLVTDSNGQVVFSTGYQPYGQNNGRPAGNEMFQFTGMPYSSATGLYYDYQRWYDPSIGRFISQDPISGHLSDPQSLNLYVYTENLPTGLIDPSGMDSCGSWGWLISGSCAFEATANWWNGLPGWAQAGIAVAAAAVIIVAAVVLIQPEFLAGVPLLGSLITTGAGAGGFACEEGGCQDIADIVAADLSSQSVDDAILRVTATRGGALPVELGNLGEGGAVSQLVNDFGVQPEEIALRESLPLGERTVRPDIVVEDSASGFRGIVE